MTYQQFLNSKIIKAPQLGIAEIGELKTVEYKMNVATLFDVAEYETAVLL